MITVYKKDSKNKIRIINFWTENNTFCYSSGLEDGKLVDNYK